MLQYRPLRPLVQRLPLIDNPPPWVIVAAKPVAPAVQETPEGRDATQRGLRFVFKKTGEVALGRPVSPKAFRRFFVQTMVDGTCRCSWPPRWWVTKIFARRSPTTTICRRTGGGSLGRGFRFDGPS